MASVQVKVLNTATNRTLMIEKNRFLPGKVPHTVVEPAPTKEDALRKILNLPESRRFHFSFQVSTKSNTRWNVVYREGTRTWREGIGETLHAGESELDAAVRGVEEELGSVIDKAKFNRIDATTFLLCIDDAAQQRITEHLRSLGTATEVINFNWGRNDNNTQCPAGSQMTTDNDVMPSSFVDVVRIHTGAGRRRTRRSGQGKYRARALRASALKKKTRRTRRSFA